MRQFICVAHARKKKPKAIPGNILSQGRLPSLFPGHYLGEAGRTCTRSCALAGSWPGTLPRLFTGKA